VIAKHVTDFRIADHKAPAPVLASLFTHQNPSLPQPNQKIL
jgi:hypothetical protein